MKYQATAIIAKEGKWFVARSLELGVASQGKTLEESKRNLREAVELYLEGSPRQKKYLSSETPMVTSIEVHA